MTNLWRIQQTAYVQNQGTSLHLCKNHKHPIWSLRCPVNLQHCQQSDREKIQWHRYYRKYRQMHSISLTISLSKWIQHLFLIVLLQHTTKPRKQTTIVHLDFYLTFYLLDHFLQPKDKNTQHKLKISHLIVYNFSSLIIISYFQSDIHTHHEAMELGFSSCQTWLKKVNLMPPPSPSKSVTILFYSQDRPGG